MPTFTDHQRDYGQINYEQYSLARRGHAFDGGVLKTWDELGEIQDAWIEGALAARRGFIQEDGHV